MKSIVLLRHGESVWNKENRFTGWTDVDLTEKGVAEAYRAGNLLKEKGYVFNKAYTSYLKRAVKTLNCVLDRMDQDWIPVEKSWRLNEKHYGSLQGLNKSETAQKYGDEQVLIWRRSYDIAPLPLSEDDPRNPRFDIRYKDESMIETTLVEGSVKLNVVSGGKRMTQMLKPNEKAEYQKGAGKIKVFGVNTEYDTAWKNGEIIFRNHPMDKVLKTQERHYHVVFEVKDNEILKSIITARFKDEQLPQVLEYLKLASGIQYAIHKPTVKDSGSGTSVVEISK